MTNDLAECVGIMHGSAFLQETVMLMGSLLDLSLAHSKQVIDQNITVINFQLQDVVLLTLEVDELLLPPRIFVIVANRRFTQVDWAIEHLHIAICGSQKVGGKIAGSQVKNLQLALSQAQTAQDQQDETKSGGHGFTGGCKGGKVSLHFNLNPCKLTLQESISLLYCTKKVHT